MHRFDELKGSVTRLFAKQRDHVNAMITEAEKLLEKAESEKDDDARYEAGKLLLQVQRGAPKHRRFLKVLAETGVKRVIDQVEADYMRDKRLHEVDEELYFAIDERKHNCDLSEQGRQFISPTNPEHFVLPDLADELTKIDGDASLDETAKRVAKEKLHAHYDDRAARLQNLNQLLKAYSLYEKDVELRRPGGQGRHRRRVHRAPDARPPLLRRAAPGDRSEGRRDHRAATTRRSPRSRCRTTSACTRSSPA